MPDKFDVEKQRRREMLRLYVGGAGNTLAGGFLVGLMLRAIAEEQYLVAVTCGLVGGWNTILGKRKFDEASKMKQR